MDADITPRQPSLPNDGQAPSHAAHVPTSADGAAQLLAPETVEAVERALRWSVREVMPIVTVDRFQMHLSPTATAPYIVLSMRLRSSLSYSEVDDVELISGASVARPAAASMIESLVAVTLAARFGWVSMDEVSVGVNALDQLTCTITAHAPLLPEPFAADGGWEEMASPRCCAGISY